MRNDTKSKPSETPSRRRRKASPIPEDYQVVLQWSAEDQCYLATIPRWQNVQTHGATLEEASRNAHEVLAMLIASARKKGEPYPPANTRHSGNLRVRLPVSLHDRLALEAEREGVSLNQWIITKLAV